MLIAKFPHFGSPLVGVVHLPVMQDTAILGELGARRPPMAARRPVSL